MGGGGIGGSERGMNEEKEKVWEGRHLVLVSVVFEDYDVAPICGNDTTNSGSLLIWSVPS